MKIAVFHELPRGGARLAANNLASQLKKNHTVDLFTINECYDPEEKQFYSSVKLFAFSPREWTGHNWPIRLYKDTFELLSLYLLERKIARQIKQNNYDVVLIQASKYLESPFLLRFKLPHKVFYLHDPNYRMLYDFAARGNIPLSGARGLYEKINRLVRKFLDSSHARKADLVLANSLYTKHMFEQTYQKQAQVAYLGVETEFFTPKKTKKDFDLLFIGSTEPLDGFDLLTDALKHLAFKPQLRTVFAEKEWLNKTEIRQLYRRSKIVIATAHHEPLGLVPLEAASCGVPVIAVAEGGYQETIIGWLTGYLVPRDATALAGKIETLLKRKFLRDKLGKQARKNAVANWTWEKRGRELEKLIHQLVVDKTPS